MQGYKLTGFTELTGSTAVAFSNVNESGSAAGSPLGMLNFDCGFTEPILI